MHAAALPRSQPRIAAAWATSGSSGTAPLRSPVERFWQATGEPFAQAYASISTLCTSPLSSASVPSSAHSSTLLQPLGMARPSDLVAVTDFSPGLMGGSDCARLQPRVARTTRGIAMYRTVEL